MFDMGSFIGGCVVGGIFAIIITLACTTAYWLLVSKETKEIDKGLKHQQLTRANNSNGGIRYGDGLDIEQWL